MCIRLVWDDNDSTILHQVFEEGWTLQAYTHSIAALEVMVENHQQPVRLIMDMTKVTTNPIRKGRGVRIDENYATRSVEHIVLVNPGYFMPVVDCPVDVANNYDEAVRLLDKPSERLLA